MEHPEYFCSWVAPHTQLRYNTKTRKMGAMSVGGHWRRMCGWKNVLPALLCTCKFELVCKPKYLWRHGSRLAVGQEETMFQAVPSVSMGLTLSVTLNA